MKISKILEYKKNIDKNILRIVKNGLKISFVFCLFAVFVLATYTTIGEPNVYYIGISLLKSGMFYIVGFIIFGIAFNKIIRD